MEDVLFLESSQFCHIVYFSMNEIY
jgi:hypothetical protein